MPREPKYQPVVSKSLAAAPQNLFVGTSGWAYTSWQPDFFPSEIPARAFLHYYASRFTSVEVNHTFRALPESHVLQSWLDATPPGFRFSFKAPEQITHRKRLLDCHEAIAGFVEAIQLSYTAGKLGALLFQLPPNFKCNLDRLADLFAAPCLNRCGTRLPIAVEFRNQSWFNEETYGVLREHGAALCVADSDELVTPDVATARFRYYRFRKSGGYSPRLRGSLAKNLDHAAHAGEVFAYLKHEDEPTGAHNALSIIRQALKHERARSRAC